MLNRSQPPPIHPIRTLELPRVDHVQLSNGVPVAVVPLGTQDVLRLDVIFLAGRPWEAHRLAARATLALLREGTKRRDGAAIAEHFDYFGSSLSTPPHLDTANLVLYAPRRYAAEVFPVLAELLAEPDFPEAELEAFKTRHQRRLEVDLQKVDVVGYRQLTELLYGPQHPYGYNSDAVAYQRLQLDWLRAHYRNWFHSGQALMVLSGKVGRAEIELLDRHLGRAIPTGRRHVPAFPEPEPAPGRAHHLPMGQPTVQTALRIGRRMFGRQHPDFAGMYVLNTVLGGYFGSRLMHNIREQKGYTYNIYSSLDTFLFDGYFYIGTEVGNAFLPSTLREVRAELYRLRRSPIPEEELEMVRSYLMGTFLTMLDGPFQVAELVRSLAVEDLPTDVFATFVERVQRVDSRELQRLANQYLEEEDLIELTVGGPPV